MERSEGYIESMLPFLAVCNKINLLHCRYDPKVRLQIAHYAYFHNVTAAAALHFLRKLQCHVQPGTVQCMKEAYLIEIKKMRAVGNTDPMNSLPNRKKGRSLLLGEKIDAMVQSYVKKVRELEEVCLAH